MSCFFEVLDMLIVIGVPLLETDDFALCMSQTASAWLSFVVLCRLLSSLRYCEVIMYSQHIRLFSGEKRYEEIRSGASSIGATYNFSPVRSKSRNQCPDHGIRS